MGPTDPPTWVVYLSLGVSVVTLLISMSGVMARTKRDYMTELEHRLQRCEKDREYLQQQATQQSNEIRNLTVRVVMLEADRRKRGD